MPNRYGPWATMIDIGANPQLSTFWRRRLTMLVPASRTSFVLSRRNLFWLGAVALLLMALPTVRFATAAVDEEKPTETGKPPTATQPDEKPVVTKGLVKAKQRENSYSGSTMVFGTMVVSNADVFLPVLVYYDLNYAGTRKALKLSGDQVKRLRDISRDFSQRQRDAAKEMRKAMETPSPDQRAAALHEYETKRAQERRVVRKQVEKLLTAEQLKTLRALAIGSRGVGQLLYDPRLFAKLDFSEGQRKGLSSRLFEDEAAKERNRRLDSALKENQDKTLALITPKQWDEIATFIGKDALQFPSPELGQLGNPVVLKQLALTAEQMRKMAAMFEKSAAETRKLAELVDEVNGPHRAKEVAAKSAELDRKMQELRKRDRAQIETLLTKQQLAVFDKLFVQQEFIELLRTCRTLAGFSQDNKESEVLDRIHATAEQKDDLRRLEDEADRLVRQSWLEAGETALQILTPQQQDKLIDALDRPSERLNAQPPTGKQGKQGRITKIGEGTLTLSNGLDVKEATKAAEKPKGPPRILPPKIDAAAAGAEAIRQFDADHDGKISGAELDKCPGLKAAIDNIDRSGNGEITAEKITARIKAWQDSKLGRMSLGCRVTHNGEPLAGAEVKFVPEKFLGDNVKIATGKTDANGMAMLSIQATRGDGPRLPPGVAPGFYRVEITKAGENIPAKYNTETVLGQEVALDAKGIQEGLTFDLKY